MLTKLSLSFMSLILSIGIGSAKIAPDTGGIWQDSDGNHINCHGGGILKDQNGTFYWYGEHRGVNAPQEGVACYVSKDLKNWENKGIVMRVSDESGAIVERGSTIERPKVIYNPKTGKYVIWFHHELKGKGYAAAQTAVAVADNPLGPFKPIRSGRVNAGKLPINLDKSLKPDDEKLKMEWWTPEWRKEIENGLFTFRDCKGGQMARDMTLFVDDDGKAYHIYSSEDNLTLQIAELDKSFTKHTGKYIRIFPGGHNEAPTIFKKDGKYWMITSGCTGWAPNEARMMWADNIMGDWHIMPNPCKGPEAEITFKAQGTYILENDSALIFMADIWNPKNLPDSRHLWLPISFDINGVPEIRYDGISTEAGDTKLYEIGEGYSGTSVNTAVFRANSVVTHKDNQYIAFYDPEGYVTLAKRKLNSDNWTIHKTQYKGNVKDGHNIISIGADGEGYLHVAFDHHGHPLHYAKSLKPGSLELGEISPMTGIDENNVTYPEFYSLSNGDLLFVYRSGASGRGNMAINRYVVNDKKWIRVQDSLIDGEEQRSPYWQLYIDENDVIHVSWVWRETWLVETNHDMCYAKSKDGGKTWLKSDNTPYSLPITLSNSEFACSIPQNSELINQTSMTADRDSNPYIVSYWRSEDSDVPQYRLIWHDGKEWKHREISNRTSPFSLSGGGTKMIPISRPRVVVDNDFIGVIYRDAERGSVVSLAHTNNGANGDWTTSDLTVFGVEAWEPSLDTELWKNERKLHMFVQKTYQGDGEVSLDKKPTSVYILETDINKK